MRISILLFGFIILSHQSICRDSLITFKLPHKFTRKINSQARLSVFLFFSAECPLCGNYTTYLNDLSKEYPDDAVEFTYIFGLSFSEREINDFVKRYSLKGSIVLDRKTKYMRAFGATTTPEVFVLDNRKQLVYSGAIDNRAYEIGKLRKVVTEQYLKSVIDATIDLAVIPYKRIPPIGCLLEQ